MAADPAWGPNVYINDWEQKALYPVISVVCAVIADDTMYYIDECGRCYRKFDV